MCAVESRERKGYLVVKLNEVPKISLCILLGLQHYITMFGGTITYPYLLSNKMCINEQDPARGYLIATNLFCAGFATFIQTTFGIRLPIIQGPTFTFLIPTIAILDLPVWKCSTDDEITSKRANSTNMPQTVTNEEYDQVWQSRMREIQGAMIIASLTEVLIGCTGIMGLFLKYISPLSIIPTITLIGLSLFKEAAGSAGENWLISVLTIALMVLFSQYLTDASIPLPFHEQKHGFRWKRIKIFRIFPVLFTIIIVWSICAILTKTEMLPANNGARTDARITVLHNSPWIRVPYPFQWGIPSFTASAVLGFFAAVIASAIESVGDYYACARLCEAPPPPKHAINRGICFEGLGCLTSAIWGSGSGLTSYSENIGAIGITKVGSRRVVQTAAIIMIFLSIFSKFSGLFATIPVPIIGGMFMIMFSIITAVGLSPLQFIDLNSSRNLFIIGISIFTGISIPKWIAANPGAIDTGVQSIDQALSILLSTGMLIGGVVGFFFDNTLPGTDEERGIHKWIAVPTQDEKDTEEGLKSYDLPFGLHSFLQKYPIFSYLPISSTYANPPSDTSSIEKQAKSLNARESQSFSEDMTPV
ncbi:solute carrier family 23 member 1-like protein [Dinothrombium tinctorium]|uniref:Solute carrier family 23 member 1-like protein n=1 Tax=Dinothrombium tinctorium TaxID=1965070 RepID=A0A3S3RPS5_9ACAR|nr:solute carrier family 23 member 1-like protein [Dinothrombium tinctorium]